MNRESFRRRVQRFLIAGVPITLCDYGVFKGFVVAGYDPSWARALSFTFSFAFAFLVHRLWTFGSEKSWRHDLGLYAAARIACFVLAQLLFMGLHNVLGLSPDLSFWLQVPVQPISNFLLGHFVIFRPPTPDSSTR